MGAPLFYSMAGGGGGQAPTGGLDTVALEKTMRENIRGLLGPSADKDLVIRWGKCLTDKLVGWFEKSGCITLNDAKKRDTCLVEAGIREAQESVFKTCAEAHVPSDWSSLSGAVVQESKRFLLSKKIPAVQVDAAAKCVAEKTIADLKDKACPTVAFFQDEGCFWTEERVDLNSQFALACLGDSQPENAGESTDQIAPK